MLENDDQGQELLSRLTLLPDLQAFCTCSTPFGKFLSFSGLPLHNNDREISCAGGYSRESRVIGFIGDHYWQESKSVAFLDHIIMKIAPIAPVQIKYCLFAKNCTNEKNKSNYLNSHGEEAQEKPPGL